MNVYQLYFVIFCAGTVHSIKKNTWWTLKPVNTKMVENSPEGGFLFSIALNKKVSIGNLESSLITEIST